jgi:8-oxo-dGTP diphosphatase
MPNNEDRPRIIYKAALAYFKDKKVLMVRDTNNEVVFYNPGGKIELGETDVECLVREIKEELNAELDKDSIVFLGEFEAPAHKKPGARVNIRLFTGELLDDPNPHDEIVELKYFDSSVTQKLLSPISIDEIFPWLKQHNYIN